MHFKHEVDAYVDFCRSDSNLNPYLSDFLLRVTFKEFSKYDFLPTYQETLSILYSPVFHQLPWSDFLIYNFHAKLRIQLLCLNLMTCDDRKPFLAFLQNNLCQDHLVFQYFLLHFYYFSTLSLQYLVSNSTPSYSAHL